MESPRSRALRVPAVIFVSLLLALGLVTWPLVGVYVGAGLARSSGGGVGSPLWIYVGLLVLGYVTAALLCARCFRAGSVRWAWILTVLGLLIVVAVSSPAVLVLAYSLYTEWQEVRPGGRGYRG